jgi:hypothetical protein
LRTAITEWLEVPKDAEDPESPLFQVLPGYPGVNLPHESTETFRDRARAGSELTAKINEAARQGSGEGVERLRELERHIFDLAVVSRELPVDLLLGYCDVSAWKDMVRCVDAMPRGTQEPVTVHEQRAQALNRRNESGDRAEAIKPLEEIIARYGPAAAPTVVAAAPAPAQAQPQTQRETSCTNL